MKAPLPPRAMRFQSLESRDLLAGNVLVENRNGALFVTGDAADNSLSIERIVDAATGAAACVVTPDATTSINGLTPGTAITLGDINRDGALDLRAGSDVITLQGNNAWSMLSLRCVTGSGDDQIVLDGLSVRGALSIDNSADVDSFSLSNVRVGVSGGSGGGGGGGSITLRSSSSWSSVTMTDCVVSQTSSKLSAISLENVDSSLTRCIVQGASKSSATLASSSAASKHIAKVEFHDCFVSSFSITHRGGGADVLSTRSSFASLFLDVDASSSVSPSSLVLTGTEMTGPLSVRLRGESSVTLDGCAMSDAFIKIENNPLLSTISSLSMSGSEFKKFSLETRGAIDVSSEACAAVDMFLKLDGIKGESTSRSSVSIVDGDITHLSLRCTQTCDVDLSSSSFFDVVCDVTQSPSAATMDALQIKMSDLLVSSACSVSTRGGATFTDVGSSKFGSVYIKLDGLTGSRDYSKATLRQVTSASSLTISSRDTTEVTLDACKSVDTFIKLERVSKASPVLARVVSTDSSSSRRFSVESIGAADVSLEACSAVDMYLKIDGIKGETARSSTSAVSCTSTHLMIVGTSPNDVSVARSSFFDLSCTVSPPASPNGVAPLEIKLSDILVSSFCNVSTSADASVDVSSSELGSLSIASTGLGTGKVSMSDLSITRSASVSSRSSTELSMVGVDAVDMFLKLERSSSSSPISTGDCDDLDISGRFSLTSTGATDFSISNSELGDSSFRFTGIKGESTKGSLYIADTSNNRTILTSNFDIDLSSERSSFFDLSVDISSASTSSSSIIKMADILITGLCAISTKSSAADMTIDGMEAGSVSLSASSGGGAGKVSVHDISVTKALSITTSGETGITLDTCTATDIYMKVDRLSRLSSNASMSMRSVVASNQIFLQGRGGFDISMTGTQSSSIYMKLDGIKGEVHRQSISLEDSRSGSLSIVSSEVQDLSVVRSSFFDVECTVWATSSSPPGALSSSSSVFEEVSIQDDFSLRTSGGSHQVSLRQCTCPLGYFSTDSASSSSSAISIVESSFSSRLSVVTRGQADVSIDQCPTADMFLKFERLSSGQPSASSLSVSNCPVDGSLSIQSMGSMDVDVDACRMVDFYLKIDALRGERRAGSINMNSNTATGRMSIAVTCPISMTVIGGFANEMFVKLDRGVNSAVDGSRIVFESTDCDDRFSLSSSSGSDFVSLTDVDCDGVSSISLGSGDDRLDITSSSLGFTSLDGGLGFDQVRLTDSVFSNEQFSINFEKIQF